MNQEKSPLHTSSELPQPVETPMDSHVHEASAAASKTEAQPVAGSLAPQGGQQSGLPPAVPPAMGQASTSDPSTPPTVSNTTVSTPPIADDEDLIEREWVESAKRIVEHTRGDPHAQSDSLNAVKKDYQKKRFNIDSDIGKP